MGWRSRQVMLLLLLGEGCGLCGIAAPKPALGRPPAVTTAGACVSVAMVGTQGGGWELGFQEHSLVNKSGAGGDGGMCTAGL